MANDEQEEGKKRRCHETRLYCDVQETQWPIIYGPEYNIGFMGLEKLHPFDAGKWGRVFEFLKEARMLRDDTSVRPQEASPQDLLVVHSQQYINNLKWSLTVAGITEVPPVALLPNFVVQKKVLRPFRFQVGGTILAGKLAVERGWAINIGGGFHHCSAHRGGGFCAYADITLCIKFLFERMPTVKKAMIVDLDAHQGNGHERDFMGDERVYILDIYNRGIYPHDGYAKRAITRRVELQFYTDDEHYLSLVRRHVNGALNEFTPDVLVFNAGTDILDGDPLGCLSISPQGIIERDQIVFQCARTRGIPIVMVTSGGYQRTTARIIADSILNLRTLGLINCEAAENCPPPQGPASSAMPRSASEGGLWARFKRSTNCINRSQNPGSSTSLVQTPSPQVEHRPQFTVGSNDACGGNESASGPRIEASSDRSQGCHADNNAPEKFDNDVGQTNSCMQEDIVIVPNRSCSENDLKEDEFEGEGAFTLTEYLSQVQTKSTESSSKVT